MIKLHLTGSNATVLLPEEEFCFIPTEDNETAVVDAMANDVKSYLNDELDEDEVFYVTESVEQIEELIKCN